MNPEFVVSQLKGCIVFFQSRDGQQMGWKNWNYQHDTECWTGEGKVSFGASLGH